jgi:hypothetical protein
MTHRAAGVGGPAAKPVNGNAPKTRLAAATSPEPPTPARSVEAILTRAEQVGGAHARRAAEIHASYTTQMAALDRDIDHAEQVAEAQERVKAARALLDKANKELQKLRGADGHHAKPPLTEVRAWAAANGIECSPAGPVPAKVMSAYRKANGAAA